MGEAAHEIWGIRACLRQGGLSRNKVPVGEPAGGSPPFMRALTGALIELNIHSLDHLGLVAQSGRAPALQAGG